MSIPPVLTTIKFRRGAAADWTTVNPILATGEPGYETDTGKMKIGNGTSAWLALPYFAGESDEVPAHSHPLPDHTHPLPSHTHDFSALTGTSGIPRTVTVVTGSEARPTADVVFWVGGEDKPTNMSDADVWFAKVPVDQAPSVPTGLVSSNISDTGFTVSWSASTDDVGVLGYRVTINGVVYATPSATTQIVAGRTPETAYTVTVAARDAANNWSDESAPLVVTTNETPAPTYLSVYEPYFSEISGVGSVYSDLGSGGQTAALFYSTTHDITVHGLRIYNPAALTSAQLAAPVTARCYTRGYAGGILSLNITESDLKSSKIHSSTRTAGQWTEILFDTPVTVPALTNEADGADTVILSVEYGTGWLGGYNHWTVAQMDPMVAAHSVSGAPTAAVVSPDGTFYAAENNFPRSANRTAAGIGAMNSGNGWYGIDILCTTSPT